MKYPFGARNDGESLWIKENVHNIKGIFNELQEKTSDTMAQLASFGLGKMIKAPSHWYALADGGEYRLHDSMKSRLWRSQVPLTLDNALAFSRLESMPLEGCLFSVVKAPEMRSTSRSWGISVDANDSKMLESVHLQFQGQNQQGLAVTLNVSAGHMVFTNCAFSL